MRRGFGGGGVSLQVGFEVSKIHTIPNGLSLPHAGGSNIGPQLLLELHPYLPAAMLLALSQETVAQPGHPSPRWKRMTFSEDHCGWGSGAPE